MNKTTYAKTAERLLKKARGRDMVQLAKNLGIKVKFFDLGGVLGVYTCKLKSRFIYVNRDIEDEHLLNMVVAHEIGHDALHRHLACHALYDDAPLSYLNRTEMEANKIAAHLLISTEDLLEAAEYSDDVYSLASALLVNENLLIIKLNELNKMGYEFNPSLTADNMFLNKKLA